MKLIVYHGSDEIINYPTHNGGRKFSDFGLEFYVTTNIEMAKSWASRRRGKPADDRMFDTLSLFFGNNITLDHCLKALNSMDLDIQYNIKSSKGISAMSFTNFLELDDLEKNYYANEVKEKKNIMNKKMIFIRQKYGKLGKYFDEIKGDDLNG